MRVRFRFEKLGKVRWTSHRDVARMWERAFRRIQLPLAYSQGFSPRPKVSFGLALPTGAESLAEYLDVELAPGVVADLSALPARLTAALPVGVDVTEAGPVEDGSASLQAEVTSCCWVVEVAGIVAVDLAERVAAAKAAP
ncbi:MAG: TIGR03936 family radical SAM-associated protein, partial [Acidimicrobiales bacterium]